MRVVHICNLPLPPDHPDAGRLTTHPGRWVLNLALAQKAHTDIQPELVVQMPGTSHNHVTQIEGIPVHFVAAPDRLRAATLFHFDAKRISRYVRQLAPDLVHAHGTEDAHLLAAQATGLPHLVTAQGCFFIINRALPPRFFSREKVVEFTEWLALRRTRHAIAKSQYVGDMLRHRFPHLTIHEIPNTFDARLLAIPINQPREPGSIAFVGTVGRRKGVHTLAKALALLESLNHQKATIGHPQSPTLHVFGNHTSAPSDYEQSTLNELRSILGDRLVLHGIIPGHEVAEKLSRIELLVAPSLEEMFGNQLIEALLAGCRAIVTEGTAMAENLRRFGSGSIVPQENPPALADAIRLLTSASAPDHHPETVRARINDWMGPATVATRHQSLYETVLTGTSIGHKNESARME